MRFFQCDTSYNARLEPELLALDDEFEDHGIPVSIVKIMIPMDSKKLLQQEFDRRLGFYRS